MSCVIIDYGSGNLHSAHKSFERAAREQGLNKEIILSNQPEAVLAADHIVLPGVGAYGDCMAGLEAIDGLLEALEDAVINQAKPFFGICVGMQLMSTEGHEHNITKGLDWIKGKVTAIKPNDPSLKIPHMGWNTLFSAVAGGQPKAQTKESRAACPPATAPNPKSEIEQIDPGTIHPILKDIQIGENGLHAYFVHSFQFEVENPAHRLLTTDYGGPVTAMVGRDNMIGTQFHPEKSQALGLKLISNFLQWTP